MQIRKSHRDNILVIQVNGRLDGNSANQLSEQLASAIKEGWRQIELDLADLGYLSSAGIRILLKYAKTMKELRGSFVVTRISDFARQVLEVAGLFELLLPTYCDETNLIRHGRVIPIPKGTIEMYDLEQGGTLSCQILGPAPDSRSLLDPSHSHPLPFPVSSFAFGVGAFGHDLADCHEHFGIFLAAGGVTACMPPDEGVLPDYMIYAEDFIPKLHVLTGSLSRAILCGRSVLRCCPLIRCQPQKRSHTLWPPLEVRSLVLWQCLKRFASVGQRYVKYEELERLAR